MKLILKNGAAFDVVEVEEAYYPRNTQGLILSIRMNNSEDIEALKTAYTPEALESVTVGEGEDAKALAGYTQIDSIRRLYSGDTGYNTAIGLVKEV